MKKWIKAICTIIGTIIGAGFISGKEIYIFFNQYGTIGILGIAIASILTGIIIYFILIQTKGINAKNYNEYLQEIKVNPKIKDILNSFVNLFLLISFYIMIAGFCACLEQEFGISSLAVGLIICLICYITFMKKIEGITKINTILIPALLILIIFIGLKTQIIELLEDVMVNQKIIFNGNWFIACLEYASYNSILLIPILISLKKYTDKNEKKISILVSLIFFILACILFLLLQIKKEECLNIELPLVYIVGQYGKIYKYLCVILITLAIYTSAIVAGYSLAENCSKTKKVYKNICILICITAVPISQIGFTNLVNTLYPVFGLLGIIQIGILFSYFVLKRISSPKK